MLKKAGIVTAGVTAALLAAAPLASAGEYHGDYDKDRDSSKDRDGDRDRDRDRDRGFGDVDGEFNNQCLSEAGDVSNDTAGVGGLLGIGQVLGPVASGSNVDILNCSNILNNVLSDNAISVGVLGSPAAVNGN